MKFKCNFCKFEADEKSLLHNHHIIPKELQDPIDNKPRNLILVCANCHNRIYIPKSKSGIHSIKKKSSIILNHWYPSTGARLIEYIDEQGNLQYSEDKNPKVKIIDETS